MHERVPPTPPLQGRHLMAEGEGCVGLSREREGGEGVTIGFCRFPRGKKYSGVVWETRIKET